MKVEMKPSEFDARYATHQSKVNGTQLPNRKLIDDIPESEKWRLIKGSGILDKVAKGPIGALKPSTPPADDFLFDAIVYAIPFTSLHVLMDNLVLKQYGEVADLSSMVWTFLRRFPGWVLGFAFSPLLLLIYLSNRFRHHRVSKLSMFAVGIFCGVKLMALMRGRPILLEMQTAPGLATLWTYTVFQLDLVPCLISVLIPALFYLYWR
ncbi:hypothetical protein L0F63_006814 [Massospora cicadina]|nr:hypothetical protein L0F63_006814 [Massospora cicadina]